MLQLRLLRRKLISDDNIVQIRRLTLVKVSRLSKSLCRNTVINITPYSVFIDDEVGEESTRD